MSSCSHEIYIPGEKKVTDNYIIAAINKCFEEKIKSRFVKNIEKAAHVCMYGGYLSTGDKNASPRKVDMILNDILQYSVYCFNMHKCE